MSQVGLDDIDVATANDSEFLMTEGKDSCKSMSMGKKFGNLQAGNSSMSKPQKRMRP